jgi:hypothetical protein
VLSVKELAAASQTWLDEPAVNMLLLCSLAGAAGRMQSIREEIPDA